MKAAAFALDAGGVLMGTRILSATECPVHDSWRQAIVDAVATDTVFLDRVAPGLALRALRTARTTWLKAEVPIASSASSRIRAQSISTAT